MSCVLIINIKISYFFLPRRKINVPSLESLSLIHSKHFIFIEWKPAKNYWVIKWWLLIKKFFFSKLHKPVLIFKSMTLGKTNYNPLSPWGQGSYLPGISHCDCCIAEAPKNINMCWMNDKSYKSQYDRPKWYIIHKPQLISSFSLILR